jgi:hypothetical protein
MNCAFVWIDIWPAHLGYYLTAFTALFAFITLAARVQEWSKKRWPEALFFFAIAFVMFAWRWPIFLAPYALNPDEGSLTAYALKATVDFAPWRGFDAGTSGPLNSYLLTLPALAGLPIGFVSARITATLLMIVAVIALYYAAKWLHGAQIARLSTIPPVLLLSLTIDYDFVHYSSEHLSICLTTVAVAATAYTFRGSGSQRSLMLAGGLAGLCVGGTLFAKLQAVPLAMAVFGLAGLAVFSLPIGGNVRRGRVVLAMLAGLCVVPGLIVTSLFLTGEFNDAFVSYIGEALRYVGDSNLSVGLGFFLFSSPMYTVFLIGASIVVLVGAITGLRIRNPGSRPVGTLIASIVLLLVAVFVIQRPHRPFPHYLLFSIIPISFCVASILGLCSQRGWWRRRSAFVSFSFPVLFLAPSLAIAMATPNHFVSGMTSNWNHRQSDVAMAIARYVKPGDALAVWGWASEYYVQTGTIMATRDADTTHMSYSHPNVEYRRRRYMSDLEKARPSVFVDAVNPNAFGLTDRASQGHETFPALKAYVRQNYRLAEHVTGVRIYAKRVAPGGASDQVSGTFSFDAKSAPGMATFENESEQDATFNFSAQGSWSYAAAAPFLGPAGIETPAASSYYLPGAHSFALLAGRENGAFQYVGESSDIRLKPHEVISFLMNDLVGGTMDNQGSLKIVWEKR